MCKYMYTSGQDVCCMIYGILGDIMGYSGEKCKNCDYCTVKEKVC